MNTNALSHNIFKYATKELSQDAFIAWLLSYACSDGKEKDHGLWSCAQSFLRSFVGKEDDSTFTVTEIKMQHCKTDVYIEMHDLKDADKKYAVIIEDKVHSTHHDNQISRYVEEIKNKLGENKRDIHVAYFKTGHIEDKEKIEIDRIKVDGRDIPIIQLPKIKRILDSTTSPAKLFDMYTEHIRDMAAERERIEIVATSDAFFAKENEQAWNEPYAQWCFLNKIFENREKDYCGSQQIFARDYMYSGSSSGTPWTQYCFWEEKHIEECIIDEKRPELHSLFWRLDPGQISLRYYVNRGLKQPNKDKTLQAFWDQTDGIDDFGIKGWKKVKEIRKSAKYEFALLEHKFSPEDKFDDLREQILKIHQIFQNVK